MTWIVFVCAVALAAAMTVTGTTERDEFDDRLAAMMDDAVAAGDDGDADSLSAWPGALRARLSDHPFLRRPGHSTPSRRGGRVSDRPKNAKNTIATTAATTTTTAAASTTTAAAIRTVFDTEGECVSAAAATADGGHRRCLCYTTDYLDRVGQRLDEQDAAENDASAATAARSLDCMYYKVAAAVFVVRPPAAPNAAGDDGGNDNLGTTTVATTTAISPNVADATAAAAAAAAVPRNVDFDSVIDYRLSASEDDHYQVHYDFVGNDVKIRCLPDGDRVGATIQWKFRSAEQKTKSTIAGVDGNELSILGLEAADSKNYTCSSSEATAAAEGAKNSKTDRPYTHNVLAVERPIYEIRGTAAYKAGGSGTCSHEIIGPLRNQMSGHVRAEMCPEGSSRYVCKVVVESADCVEEGKMLTIEYSVTLNDMSSFLTKIRTSRTGRDPLQYQQVVARMSNVLTANLDKTMSAQIVTRFSSVDTRYEPDFEQMTIKTFVSCAPGFGIREVFCAACPPHHYSPEKSADCLKCPRGFHQPVAGSDKCVKCVNPLASGCFVDEVLTSSSSSYVYGIAAVAVVLVFVLAASLWYCCCRKGNKKNVRKIQSMIRRKWKKRKNLLPTFHRSSTGDSKRSSSGRKSAINISKSFKLGETQKQQDSVDKLLRTPFNTIHEMFTPRL